LLPPWSCQLPPDSCPDGTSLKDADEPIHGKGFAQEDAGPQPARRGRLHSRGINNWFVGPDEADGGANLPAVDLATELDGALETVEGGCCDKIESILSGGSQDSLIAGLFEGEGNQGSKFCVILNDEDGWSGSRR
jgi:hypothetical protein